MPGRHIAPGDWPDAIAVTDGAQIILAGPGTGKTEFLVRRAAHLVQSGVADPQEIVALTFSRRAAADMRSRIEERLARSMVQISVSTFHSFAHRLLEYVGPEVAGWSRLPGILTGPEQVAFVASLLSEERAEHWPKSFRRLLGTQTLAKEITDFILRARERLVDEASLRAMASDRADWRALPHFFDRYDRALIERNRIDYGTLQVTAVRILGSAVPEAIRSCRYLLVDEYQDTTLAQARLLEQLAAFSGHVTVAADPSQSIYGFRGAQPENIEAFGRRFTEAARLFLEDSFRVPEPVLAAAKRVASAAPGPPPTMDIRPARHAGSVEVAVFDQHSHEAEWIAGEVERSHTSEGIPYSRLAILVRTKRRLLTELSRALARRGIPHDQPQARLADTPAVRAVLDCVAAAMETDTVAQDAAMARVLLGPLFRTPLGRFREITRARSRGALSWSAVVRDRITDGDGLADLLDDDRWLRIPADEGFWVWWSSLPQLVPLADDPAAGPMRAAWSSLAQVLARLVEREASTTLIDYAGLATQEDFEATPLLSYRRLPEDRVTLATLHQSKGLEYDVVFIADAVEGVFPDLRRERSILQPHLIGLAGQTTAQEAARARLAEEMRLAYVGMVRARKRVIWTATLAGIDEGQLRPSRFLPLVAGTRSVSELPGPEEVTPSTTTKRGAEAALRRVLADPTLPASERLAAAGVLAAAADVLAFAGVREPGPDFGTSPDLLRLSPTQADLYERCPLRYVLSRRLRIGDEESVYARFGSLIHRVLEQVERVALVQGRRHGSLPEALVVLERLITDYEFGPPPQAEAWRKRGVECLERLYNHWPSPEAEPVALEREFRLQLDETEWLGFADRVERVGEATRIVDYKTSKNAPPPDELSLQLGFYALAADADPRITAPVLGAQAWYPLAGTRRPRVVEVDLAALPEIRERLIAIARDIKSGQWKPRPHEGCERCPVRVLCPEWPEGKDAFVP